GRLLERQGKLIEARNAFELAMRVARGELAPRASPAQSKIASVADLEQRLAGDPATRQLHAALASATNLIPPAQVAPHQVATLFDRYAESFDEHLREKLEYHVPELLTDAIAAATERSAQMDILDLG